jgi:hypothetical protein
VCIYLLPIRAECPPHPQSYLLCFLFNQITSGQNYESLFECKL